MTGKMTLGVDFGGSSSKATLIDESGTILATAVKEYPSYCPKPGWLEQDATQFYPVFVEVVREILHKSGVCPDDVVALAIDAATHMAIFADEQDQPIRRMIHWSDKRCVEEVRWLEAHHSELLKRCSANSVGTAWTLPQILWLQKHEPEVLQRTKRIYFAKDYIRHCITGDFDTDYIEAMGAMLADDESGTWSKELCDLAGIDMSMLPEIRKPTDVAGHVSAKTSDETGLSEQTVVYVGTTDTALEVYASGAVEVGCTTVKLATAGRICPVTTGPVASRQFFNYRHVVPGLWYPGTGTSSCAASYKWYRDVFGTCEKEQASAGNQDAYELLNQAAEQVPAGSEHLYFHPYLLGEMTPYYDNQLRASFIGASMHHTKGHFTRAVMEGVAYSLRDSMEEIYKNDVMMNQFRIIGGGAKGKLWKQIVADVLNVPMVCTANNDSSLGSAMLAGVACGMFADYGESVEKCVKVVGVTEPVREHVAVYKEGFEIYRKIQKALAPIYHAVI